MMPSATREPGAALASERRSKRQAFSGYRVRNGLVMESRLTHELASWRQATWLSQKERETLPFRFWSLMRLCPVVQRPR